MSLDILISFDTTGSMMPCISEVRRKVSDFVSNIYDTYPEESYTNGVRIGIIAHGDYCDGKRVITRMPFKSKNLKEDVVRFVNEVKGTSGGDSDECYEYVLYDALENFEWRSDNRIMILIGDAEPHGKNERQNFLKLDWKEQAQRVVDNGITIYPVQCLRYSSSADYFYNGLAKISQAPKLELAQFSNITQLLMAIYYKQVSDEKVVEYGEQLKASGELNRNLAHIMNLLLEAEHLVGGIEYSEKKTDLEAVHPSRFQTLNVDRPCVIKDFVAETGAKYKKGKGFYQLTKSELVQEHKEVIVRDKMGDMFSGAKARQMIGLPYGVRGHVNNRDIPSGYDVFIQSTSYTRKLMPHTQFLYEVEDYKD